MIHPIWVSSFNRHRRAMRLERARIGACALVILALFFAIPWFFRILEVVVQQ